MGGIYMYYIYYMQCGSEMVASLWITEISSPFLHLRELLKELGYRDTDLNLIADVSTKIHYISYTKFASLWCLMSSIDLILGSPQLLFAVTFTVARMVCGPLLTYVTLSASNPLLIKVWFSINHRSWEVNICWVIWFEIPKCSIIDLA